MKKFDSMTIYKARQDFIDAVEKIEIGRILHRDTCAADPERMPPPKIEELFALSPPEGVPKIEVLVPDPPPPKIEAADLTASTFSSDSGSPTSSS